MASEVAVNNVTPLPAPQHSPQTYAVRTASILANPEQCKINMRAAEMFAESDLVPKHFRGKPANCFIAINRAQRLGIDELYFLEKTFVIGGKLGMAAELAIELANASGRFRGQIKFRLFGEGEARGCTAFATLASDGEVVENTVTYAMAKADGWTSNNKWNSLRDQMLQYRAGVFLARLYAGGSMGGMYTREELEDVAAQSAKPIGAGTTGQMQIEPPGDALPETRPPGLSAEEIEAFEAKLKDELEAINDLVALDDHWRGGANSYIREVGGVDKKAQHRMISAFSQRKNEILETRQADQEGVDPSDAIPAYEGMEKAADDARVSQLDKVLVKPSPDAQEAPQKPAQADPAPAAAKPRDQIDNALDALRKGDEDDQEKVSRKPPPTAITIQKNEDGSDNLSGFYHAARAQLQQATDEEYGDAWLVEWLKANGEALAKLKQANPAAEKKISGFYMQTLDYQKTQREEAEAEALTEFPTIEVTYNGDSPDWPAFLRNLHGYLGDTPNHRVARAWWTRHSFQVGIIAKTDEVEPGVSGKAAAAEFKTALFARFPQLAD